MNNKELLTELEKHIPVEVNFYNEVRVEQDNQLKKELFVFSAVFVLGLFTLVLSGLHL